MEPAHDIPWRPLGQLLVDRGLITEAELEEALDEQATTGERLGEVLVKRGLVSGPGLTQMLMEQLGIELKKEEGFGSGLWAAIKQRHPRGAEEDEASSDLVEPDSSSDEPAPLVLVDRLYERLEAEVGPEPAIETHEVLREELANLRAGTVALEAELEAERSARAAAEVELELAQAETREASDAAVRPAEAVAEAEARVQELEERVEEAEQRAEWAEQRADQAEQADQKLHDAARQAEESEQRIAELEQALDLASARFAQLEPDLEATRAHAAGLEERMEAERTAGTEALSGLEQALTELASRHELLQQQRVEEREVLEEFDRVRIELDHRDARIAELDSELEALRGTERTARQHAEQNAHEAEARVQELEERVEEAEQRAEWAEQRADQAEQADQKLHDAARQAEESEQRIAELEQALDLASARFAQLEPDLEATRAHAAGLEERMEAERTAGTEALSGLEQALTELASRHELLQQQRVEEREVLEEFDRVRIELDHRDARIAELDSELEALRGSEGALAAREAELAVLGERIDATENLLLREQEAHAETRRLLATALEQIASRPGAVEATGHLLFVPNPDGYELIELDGPAPGLGAEVEHAAIPFVVSKLGRSPLPLDRRPCAYLVPA